MSTLHPLYGTLSSSYAALSIASAITLATCLLLRRTTSRTDVDRIPTLPMSSVFYFLSVPRHAVQYFRTSLQPMLLRYGIARIPFTPWCVVGRLSHAKYIAKHPDIVLKADLQTPKFSPYGYIVRFLGVNVVMSNGAAWKRYRRVLSPAFRGRVPIHVFKSCTEELLEIFDTRKRDEHGEFVVESVNSWMSALLLQMLGLTIIGHNFDALRNPHSKDLIAYHRVMDALSNGFYFIFTRLDRWWFPFRYGDYCALWRLQGLFDRVIAKRRGEMIASGASDSEAEHRDVLSLMIRATSSTDPETRLSEQELKDNLAVLFFAGHDTTSSTLFAAIYLLAKHPEYQDRIRHELDTSLPEDHSIPTASQKLPLLDAVIRETLRLYPPIIHFPIRELDKDTEFEFGSHESPHMVTLPKDTPILLNTMSVQRDPYLFPEPERFYPERFIKASERKTTADSLLPDTEVDNSGFIAFNSGSRVCLGMNFSLAEQRTVLSMLLRKYSWRLPEDSIHQEELIFDGSQALIPRAMSVIFKDLA